MTCRAALLSLALAPALAFAQSPAEHIAIGDRERMDPNGALRHYEAALVAEPSNYAALYKAAGAAVEAGQVTPDVQAGRALYKRAEDYAKRAVQVNANDAEGHFELARALGRNAQTMGSRDRVKFAADVRSHALEALKLNPKHDGALHIMGMWNAEVMRLSGITRFAAKNFLGGKVFDQASWNDAQRNLEEAVAIAPTRIAHRIDLAEVYLDRGNKGKAREQLDAIARIPAAEATDVKFKRQAEALRPKAR